ncbi:thioesterase family protein [Fundicoccus culcitae]|uniref:Thioesterase family protein n=1 Tax=Fundicoccus culcitae TaxID=2969821 RepID=A0ABY5PA70_9LACT|nr:thioesterase family protein [Fundicoccus culcitae]UUX35358.1 thioesterase family protein [Fundicoccus culcitae]
MEKVLEKRFLVTDDMSAAKIGSGSVPVLSSPSLVALMEITSMTWMLPLLDEDQTSVGVEFNLKHLAASELGVTVRIVSKMVENDGRSYAFELEAFDGELLVATATHKRFVVDEKRFMDKLMNR